MPASIVQDFLGLLVAVGDNLRHVPPVIFLTGLFIGLAYGLLGIGLVLVYRSSKFINFAHGDIGAFGASTLGILVLNYKLNYWIALPLGMLVSAMAAGLVELLVVRRLARAPRLMSMVATIGAGQFLFFLALIVSGKAGSGAFFPEPAGLPSFTLNHVFVSTSYTGMILLAPLAVVALAIFFRRSRFGIAIRGAAANAEAAAMAGMSPARLATLTWAISGALACVTAALLIHTLGARGGASLGPTLLVRALAAGVIGRMRNLPATFVAGIGIGVLDTTVNFMTSGGGFGEVILLGIIIVALLFQTERGRRDDDKGSWSAVQPWAPLPEPIARLWTVHQAGLILTLVALAAALWVPHFTPAEVTYSLVVLVSFAIVGLSLYVVTGLSGQLSLGQFAIAATGALAGVLVVQRTHSYELALVGAAAAGAVTALLVALPALRVRGLLLAVTSLAFALAMSSWLLQQAPPFGFGTAVLVGSVRFLGQSTTTPQTYWYVALAVLVLCILVARNLRRSSLGRLLVALRDNEDAARAFGVSATGRKLQSYAVSGALAGLGGGVFAFAQTSLAASSFPAQESTTIVVMSVVGGVGIVAGPLLGAWTAMPRVVTMGYLPYAAITFGWLLLILQAPNGVAGLLRPVRDAAADLVARLHGVDPVAARASADPARVEQESALTAVKLAPRTGAQPHGGESSILAVDGVTKRYGGLVAVDGVGFDVRRGEVLGLIGPNGAGKTTLFECLSGFVSVDQGSVRFNDVAVTRWTPERRARAGLIRSFQDSALFSTMTVLETVLVSCERTLPSHVASSLLGWHRSDRRRDARARELISLLGLDRYRHVQVGSLSTGTRRIAELACLMALEPEMLLLDEPSSGIAQKEVESLGEVISGIKRYLGTTLVIIEHDIPLVTHLSDRMMAMANGSIVALGSPDEVLGNATVIESYLGGDPTAVQRSEQSAPTPKVKRKVAATAAGG